MDLFAHGCELRAGHEHLHDHVNVDVDLHVLVDVVGSCSRGRSKLRRTKAVASYRIPKRDLITRATPFKGVQCLFSIVPRTSCGNHFWEAIAYENCFLQERLSDRVALLLLGHPRRISDPG